MKRLSLLLMAFAMCYSCSNPHPSKTETSTQTSESPLVYVCISTGSTAYHSTQNCSYLLQCRHQFEGMTKEDAIAAGKQPCTRCYKPTYPVNAGYTHYSRHSDEDEIDGTSSDGTHSATVEYYNPNTGYTSTYTLDVEVEDNQVKQINFPNGGYLDNDHIEPADIEDGKAHVEGEDGKTYDVELDD